MKLKRLLSVLDVCECTADPELDVRDISFDSRTTQPGDLFAAVLTAGLMQGDSPAMAMDRATRYVEITVKTTFGYGADPREGAMLERTLGWLTQKELPRGYRTL